MLSIGELAKIARISIRTLHYYDEIGLLKPSAKSESGYRLYSDHDSIKLQQIIALKKFGFSLAQISEVITEKPHEDSFQRWQGIFRMELKKIQEERTRLEELEKGLHAIIHSLQIKEQFEPETIWPIVHSIHEDRGGHFLSSHFTPEEQAAIQDQLPDLMKKDAKTDEWLDLLHDIHEAKGLPIDSEISQSLAQRISCFLSNTVHIEDPVLDKYWEKVKPDEGKQEKVIGLDRDTMEFIEKILIWHEKHKGETKNAKE